MDARGYAGEAAIALLGDGRHVDRKRHGIVERLEAAVVAAVFGQFEQPALGILDLRLRRHVERRVIGDVDHVLADGDQCSTQRQIVDGAAIILRVDDRHGLDGKTREILCNRHVADLFVGRQEVLDGDRVGSLAHADDVAGDLEDLPVQMLVEMDGFQEVGNAVVGIIVNEDGAKQGLLRLDIAGRFAIMLVGGSNGGELARNFVHFPSLHTLGCRLVCDDPMSWSTAQMGGHPEWSE